MKLTRRQAALSWNSQAPLGADVPVPAKRASPTGRQEWHLQAECIAYLTKRQRLDATLRAQVRFITAQPEGRRSAKRAGMAKMLGLRRGVADIILLKKRGRFRMDWCELKRPGEGLSDEQEAWANWFLDSPVYTHVITTLDEFIAVLDA